MYLGPRSASPKRLFWQNKQKPKNNSITRKKGLCFLNVQHVLQKLFTFEDWVPHNFGQRDMCKILKPPSLIILFERITKLEFYRNKLFKGRCGWKHYSQRVLLTLISSLQLDLKLLQFLLHKYQLASFQSVKCKANRSNTMAITFSIYKDLKA